jgi:aminopeptidase N
MKLLCPLFTARFLFVLTLFCSSMRAEKPFSFEATPGKLPKEVVPVDYSVRIVPDIDKFTFTGTERVRLDVRRAVHRVVLNALELKIIDASVDGKALPG